MKRILKQFTALLLVLTMVLGQTGEIFAADMTSAALEEPAFAETPDLFGTDPGVSDGQENSPDVFFYDDGDFSEFPEEGAAAPGLMDAAEGEATDPDAAEEGTTDPDAAEEGTTDPGAMEEGTTEPDAAAKGEITDLNEGEEGTETLEEGEDSELLADPLVSAEGFLYHVETSGASPEITIDGYVDTAAKELVIPGKIQADGYGDPLPVTSISAKVFGVNEEGAYAGLKKVTLPASLKRIGESAFWGTAQLTDVVLENGSCLTRIGNYAFNESGITSFTFPETLTYLGDGAFWECKDLSDIQFTGKNCLEHVGDYAFQKTGISSVTFSDRLTYLGEGAFHGCPNLQSVIFEEGNPITSIPRYAFFENGKLTEVVLPRNLETIGEKAFDGAGLKSVEIPSSVKVIEDFAFNRCESLASVKFAPDASLQTLSNGAFANSGLTRISLPASLQVVEDNAFICCAALKQVEFAENGKLNSIGMAAFEQAGLTSVTIPKTVAYLGEGIFRQCANLETAAFEEGTKLTSIPQNAFQEASRLKTVTFPAGMQLETIKDRAFYRTGLTSVILPASLKVVEPYAFAECGSLSRVVFEGAAASLESIGGYAFSGTALTELELMTYNNVSIGEAIVDKDVTVVCPAGTPIVDALTRQGIKFRQGGQILQAVVQNEKGEEITSGYTITWYRKEDGSSIGTGSRIAMADGDSAENYGFSVELGETLGQSYYQPEPYEFVAGTLTGTVKLSPLTKITVKGRVINEEGSPLQAQVEGVALINGKYEQRQETKAKADGTFAMEVVNDEIFLQVSLDGYYSRQSRVSYKKMDGSSADAGDLILYALPESKIALSAELVCAMKQSSKIPARTEQINALGDYVFTVTDSAGKRLEGVKAEKGALYLGEENASRYAKQTLTVHAEYPPGGRTAEDVSVELNEFGAGRANIIFVENGKIEASGISGSIPAQAYVFDEAGNKVEMGMTTSVWTSEALPQGKYKVVFLKKQDYIQDIQNLKFLDELGLKSGRDYVLREAEVKNGVISQMSAINILGLSFSGSDYVVKDNCYVSVSRGNAPVGSLISLRVGYQIKDEYRSALKNKKLVIPLPEGMEYIANSVTVNGASVSSAVYEGHQLSLTLNADSAEVRILMMPTSGRSYSVSPFLRFEMTASGGTASVIQPLSTAYIKASALSLSVPGKTAMRMLDISGTALSGSTVTVYTDDVPVASVKAKASGTWYCQVDLGEIPRSGRAYHYIYAVIDSSYGYSYTTNNSQVVFDVDYADVSKVVMTNFGHEEITTVWNFHNGEGKVGSYDFNPSVPNFTFQVYFNTDTPEKLAQNIPEVYLKLTSQRGKQTWVPAKYDKETKTWVGSRELDYDTVPASLSVSYDQPPVKQFTLDYDNPGRIISEMSEGLNKAGIDFSESYDMKVLQADSAYTRIALLPKESGIPEMYMVIELVDASAVKDLQFTAVQDADGSSLEVASDLSGDSAELRSSIVLKYTKDKAMRITMGIKGTEEELLAFSFTTSGSGKQLILDMVEVWKNRGNVAGGAMNINSNVGVGSDATQLFNRLNYWDTTCMDLVSKINGYYIPMRQRHHPDRLALYSDQISDFSEKVNDLSAEVSSYYSQWKASVWKYYTTSLLISSVLQVAGTALSPAWSLGLLFGGAVSHIVADVAISCGAANKWLDAYAQQFQFDDPLSQATGMGLSVYKSSVMSGIDGAGRSLESRLRSLISEIQSAYHEDPLDDEPLPLDTDQPSPDSNDATPDPSGYVYEAVPSNRLEGVTASIYRQVQQYDEAGEPVGDPQWELWDANAYDQVQDQVTKSQGTYGWDVPYGKWKVKFSKPGYRDQETGVMEVPPEWTDVNVGLVSTEAPAVLRMNACEDYLEIAFTKYMVPASVAPNLKVTVSGKAVSGKVTAVNEESDYEKTASYASVYRFTPSAPFKVGDTLSVSLTSGVKGYNQVRLGAYTGQTPVQTEIKSIKPTDIPELLLHREGTLLFTLGKAGAGKKVTVENLTPSLISVNSAAVTADSKGQISLKVKGLMPGSGVLRLSLKEYGLELQQQVTVNGSCDHVWDAGVLTKKPTASEKGVRTYTCTICGEKKTEEVSLEKISSCTVTLSKTKLAYTGKAQTPAVTVKMNGKKLVKGTDFKVTYSANVKVGTGKVKVTGIGIYTGSKTVTFKIVKAGNKITASNVTKSYSAKAQSFSLGVKRLDKAKLTYKSNNKNITVNKSGKVTVKAKYVGKAVITITAAATSNCKKTTKKITVTVNPSKTALSAVTNVKGRKLKAVWKKNVSGTGYEIQYSLKAKFPAKGTKTITVKGAAKVSASTPALTKGKTYYVRIRTVKTVGKVKYASAWSTAKKVKITK